MGCGKGCQGWWWAGGRVCVGPLHRHQGVQRRTPCSGGRCGRGNRVWEALTFLILCAGQQMRGWQWLAQPRLPMRGPVPWRGIVRGGKGGRW